jgi:hypothetical protein
MRIPEDLSVETQKALCLQHVRHFENLIELGKSDRPAARTVRVVECQEYLQTWQAGLDALHTGHAVPAQCGDEMRDCVEGGDADDVMTAEELARWNAEGPMADDPIDGDGGAT